MSWLESEVEVIVKSGLGCDGEVLAKVEALLAAEGSSKVAALHETVGQAWQKLSEQDRVESGWAEPTTNDAIDRAFEELRGAGILAFQGIGSQVSSGWPEVQDAAKRQAGPVRGATFFHGEDLEGVVLHQQPLRLEFGALVAEGTADAEAVRAIGHEVKAALARHGVEAHWDGDAESPLSIPGFVWRKRRRNEPIRDWMVGGVLRGLVAQDDVPREVAVTALSRVMVELAHAHYGPGFVFEADFDEASSRVVLFQVVHTVADDAAQGVVGTVPVSQARAAGLAVDADDELLFVLPQRDDDLAQLQESARLYGAFLPLYGQPRIPPVSARELRERILRIAPSLLAAQAQAAAPVPEENTPS
ncbi:hypothetical protein LZ198_13665 [Myxococcus sp. K15C18031901]|uniref:DUF6891 domain-containing protein n=1 Tax=Myxococcus dinghuensis TaxID=2906761 RepID=UPI0020A7A569|nr:hypothetical protein [Myxococcus dinghuensis]MCP3099918.1 hypothetical protein [Myxococcus dinghuensis]